MEIFALITPITLMLSTLGVAGGIIFGAIPGMTATMALAVFLPITYALNINQALSLLIGLYVGGISGGLIPAVLLNIPGTPSSITTTFDGYPMTKKGQGERALKIGIVSSLIGGLISAAVLAIFAPALADVAIRFSYVEKFLIIVFALTVIASISQGSMMVGLLSGSIGILLSLIGTYESTSGGNDHLRLIPEILKPLLRSGFSLLPVLIGMFALTAIFTEAEKGAHEGPRQKLDLSSGAKFKFSIFKDQIVNVFRSGLIGTFVGLLPGVGGSAASVLSYTQAKNFSKHPEKMGTGVTEGLVASETANNGLTGGALIPLVSLGIPGDSTTAVLIGAFTLQGIQLGPLFINNNPEAWNGMLSSLIISNIVMFFMMFFAIKYFAKVVFVPKFILYPIIIVMCTVGAYAINYGVMFDVWTLLIFGILAWIGSKVKLQIPSLLIGFILGRQLEIYFVKSLESFGTFTIFFTKSKIAWVLWAFIILSIVWSIVLDRRQKTLSRNEKSRSKENQ
jgi:putative tricarboxylic transport membrane protein